MKKLLLSLASCLIAGAAFADSPVNLTDTQMDQVTGGSFVCPVISTDNVLHSPRSGTLGPIDGQDGEVYYTIGGPTLPDAVPVGATNGDGTGSPGGPYTAPGNSTYTAIWYQG
jgi:hypothetical protein